MQDAYFVYGSGWDKEGIWRSGFITQDVAVTNYETADEPVRTIEVKSAHKTIYFALLEISTMFDSWPDHYFTIFSAHPKFATEDMQSVAILQANRFNIEQLLAEAKEAN